MTVPGLQPRYKERMVLLLGVSPLFHPPSTLPSRTGFGLRRTRTVLLPLDPVLSERRSPPRLAATGKKSALSVLRLSLTGTCNESIPCLSILTICSDNEYTLYVNGDEIGSGNNFPTSQAYIVTTLAAKSNVFAVLGTNTATVPNPAGLIATILITYSDGTSETFITDTTWRTFVGAPPSNFTEPAIDDSTWSSAIVVGKYGDLPWGDVTVPLA